MGSFAATRDDRREAIGRPLDLIEELLAACCGATVTANRQPFSAVQKGGVDKVAGGESKRGRKRGKGRGGKACPTTAAEETRAGGGEEGVGGGESEGAGFIDEAVVLRAHALEAAVSLCSLLPPDDESGAEGREETLGRLLRWHER